ncbi:MAG: HAMP domain-containing histidine kinase [Bdellovibrionales bacterium]|nr:HAMP domain-containing histidine kinase [Bdellovibrionales bacterium]
MNYKNLLRILVHDVSNYLTVTHGYLELIKPEVKQSKNLEKLISVINNLTELVGGIKALEALKTNGPDFYQTDETMRELLNSLLNIFSSTLAFKSIVLKIEVERNLQVPPINTSILKYQVIGNLLSNAIKFSNPNSEINIHAYSEGHDTFLKIKDQGVGIPKEVFDSLFEWDKKSQRKGTSGELGTGFGLPIVKQIVEIYGGTIAVVSPLDKTLEMGTEITLKFSKEPVNK